MTTIEYLKLNQEDRAAEFNKKYPCADYACFNKHKYTKANTYYTVDHLGQPARECNKCNAEQLFECHRWKK